MVFDIIETMETCTDPVHIFAASHATFKPGNIGQLVEIDGNLVCVLSDGTRPFGVIGDYKLTSYEGFDPNDIVRIWPQRMVFRTDEFDTKPEYSIGNAMYVSENGLLTSESPRENAMLVARLMMPPTAEKGYLEVLWL